MDKSKKILILANIVLIGFVLAVIFHYISGFYMGMPYPFNTFLGDPKTFSLDFDGLLNVIRNYPPYSVVNFWINYFPLGYIILLPFSFIKNHFVAHMLLFFIFLIPFLILNIKSFSSSGLTKLENFRNIFILSAITHPMLYLFDRGNIDLILFVLFAGFILCFKKEKYLFGAVLLAIVNAIKPFPVLFLLLFLFKKKYKEFFLSVLTTIFLIFIGFMMFKGGIFNQISVFLANLIEYKELYVLGNNSLGMTLSSSLYMMLKFLLTQTSKPIMSTVLLVNIYSFISVLITGMVIFFVWKEKVFWKQVSLLTLQMLLIPYVINDYKYIFLFVPIWLFVNTKKVTKFDLYYAILFGLLLIPKNVIFYYFVSDLMHIFSPSIIINPIVVMSIIGIIIYEQFLVKENKNG